MERRQFLKLSGGGVILAAMATGGGFLATREPEAALAPWRRAGKGYDDPRLEALSWAILAPNPHNRQPWVVRLDGGDGFTLFVDLDRRLSETDPFDRQNTIGLGCFLEIARQAASHLGYEMEVSPFPDGEPQVRLDERPVAKVRLVKSPVKPDSLFAQVGARRSCREPFDLERRPTMAELTALKTAVGKDVSFNASLDPEKVQAISEICWQGHVVESETKPTHMESVNLMRIGKAEIEANPDGISLGGPFLETLKLIGMLDREQLADPGSEAYRQGMEMYQAMFEATPAFVWLGGRGNQRVDQLNAGRDWVRLNLAATGLGLALHPVSQTLQEYPEMKELYQQVHTLLQGEGEGRIHMIGRLGYGPTTSPSPRWPLATRVQTA